MKCHDARELFSARVDDELTPDQRAGLDAHLAACGECRRELARFEGTVALLHGTAPARAPAGFVDRVLAAARPVPWYTRLGRRLWTPLAWALPVEATVVVLVAVTAVYLYQRSPELQRVTRPEPSYPAASQAARLEAPAPTRPAPAASAPAAAPPVPPVAPVPLVPPVPQVDVPAGDKVRALAKTRPATPEPARPLASAPESAFRGQVAPAMPPVTAASKPDVRASKELDESKQERAGPPEAGRTDVSRDAIERQAPATAHRAPAPAASAPAPSAPMAAPPALPAARPAEAPAAAESATRAREETAKRANAGGSGSVGGSSAGLRAIAVPEVEGRLAVADRVAAERALRDLLARVGATQVSDRREAGAVLVEAIVPGAAYAELIDGLGRIGRWQSGQVPVTVSQVRVLVRITE